MSIGGIYLNSFRAHSINHSNQASVAKQASSVSARKEMPDPKANSTNAEVKGEEVKEKGLFSFFSSAGTQREKDSANGIGLIEGALQFSKSSEFKSALNVAQSAYSFIKNFGKSDPVSGALQGAATGAYIGSIIPGVGTVIGGVVGGLLGAAAGFFKKKKHPDQIQRDQFRKALFEKGIFANGSVTLGDGSTFDITKDGKSKIANLDGSFRPPYNVDFQNPLAGQAVGWINPVMALLTGGNKKLQSDFTGYLVNAAVSNANDISAVRLNALTIMEQIGVAPDKIIAGLDQLRSANKINDQEFMAYANGLASLIQG